ncbi:MAG: FAD-dependent oxidoreductase [Eubacteriaceae bacterium]|nr:FAD-dependent oxidoreductase [Eubacteriaceae bacterium]
MTTITEPSKEIPVRGEADVIVVGGGLAGVSAALAAARCGKKVILIEKSIVLGGLAPWAMYASICP